MADQTSRPKRFTRRRMLAAGLAGLGTLAGGVVYATQIEPFWPVVTRVTMDLPRLGSELAGLKLVQISDLHLSGGAPASYLRQQIDRCTRLAPDLVVITGDFVHRGHPGGMNELGALVRPLSAKYGVFAVLGNHDYNRFQPARQVDARALRTASTIAATLAANGVRVLRNESCVVSVGASRLQLAGVDDYWADNYDPPAAFAAIERQSPCIALCHNPDAIEDLANLPCDWILSGHTHGGQVRIPLLGAPVIPIRNRQYDAGLFQIGDKRLYVNRGLGYLERVRFNCRPEITEFTLRAREAGAGPRA